MSFGWNPWGAFGILAMLLACGMGVFVFATRPDRPQNRRLALALVLGGLSVGPYFGAAILARDPATAAQMVAVGITFLIPAPAAYLYFLATVPSPFARPLQSRAAPWILIGYVLAIESVWLLNPQFFFGTGLTYFPGVGGWHVDMQQPLIGIRVLGAGMLALAELYGLIVAVSAYRRATTRAARQRALAFAIAFGTRDLFGAAFVLYFGAFNGVFLPGGQVLFIVTVPALDLLFYALLSYGILKSQLFDIDLRLKIALRRSTIAVPFAVAFFVASEALEAAVPINGFWLGLVAAASIVLLLRPLQAGAATLADRVMPNVTGTAEYLQARKSEVYRNAVEAFLEDGTITDRERRVLDRLCGDLGIDAGGAHAIEQAALDRRLVPIG